MISQLLFGKVSARCNSHLLSVNLVKRMSPRVWLGMALSAETLRATPRLLQGILPKDVCLLQLTNLLSTCPSDKEISPSIIQVCILSYVSAIWRPHIQPTWNGDCSQAAVATHADFFPYNHPEPCKLMTDVTPCVLHFKVCGTALMDHKQTLPFHIYDLSIWLVEFKYVNPLTDGRATQSPWFILWRSLYFVCTPQR